MKEPSPQLCFHLVEWSVEHKAESEGKKAHLQQAVKARTSPHFHSLQWLPQTQMLSTSCIWRSQSIWCCAALTTKFGIISAAVAFAARNLYGASKCYWSYKYCYHKKIFYSVFYFFSGQVLLPQEATGIRMWSFILFRRLPWKCNIADVIIWIN